jgi:uncharacterized glyoxalase superfamily protein PhnB
MAKWIPEGWHSLTPRLVVQDVAKLVGFLKQAFGATGDLRTDRPSQMRIGDSLILVSGVGPRDPMPAFLYLYVVNADTIYQRALEAGAVSLEEPADMPYGDRRGMVKDPCGNIWQIATHTQERETHYGSEENVRHGPPRRRPSSTLGRARKERRRTRR